MLVCRVEFWVRRVPSVRLRGGAGGRYEAAFQPSVKVATAVADSPAQLAVGGAKSLHADASQRSRSEAHVMRGLDGCQNFGDHVVSPSYV